MESQRFGMDKSDNYFIAGSSLFVSLIATLMEVRKVVSE